MTFELVIGEEITLGIKPRLFLADSSDASALSADVDMTRWCIDCELKPSIDVFFWSKIDNLSSDEAWKLLNLWIDSKVDLVLYKISSSLSESKQLASTMHRTIFVLIGLMNRKWSLNRLKKTTVTSMYQGIYQVLTYMFRHESFFHAWQDQTVCYRSLNRPNSAFHW